ncbi:hypothetical protein K493DRAFT_296180 [Basidiobolus meristosporus CBS 931.73]|uniref:Uncharacterized protein n=1 Tax=Basidiobolus meristosporus CBS 931.73 TaxID=1314790 RepID=A0A1Y1Z7Y1_9FUNG|nr:hypothetical protein K493DRAFT_296180 [Basidiobolus meristosporus CBS 931.73]|eukprot:ORY06107.1 hypothetical protein K493DRAFT_296180 [Basidiobolus meristosporus CBS 931.73]
MAFQSVTLNKYRVRWEKLKESARKKNLTKEGHSEMLLNQRSRDKPADNLLASEHTEGFGKLTISQNPEESCPRPNLYIDVSPKMMHCNSDHNPERDTDTVVDTLTNRKSVAIQQLDLSNPAHEPPIAESPNSINHK